MWSLNDEKDLAQLAIKNNDINILKQISNLSKLLEDTQDKQIMFYEAILNGHITIAKILLEIGIPLDKPIKDNVGRK